MSNQQQIDQLKAMKRASLLVAGARGQGARARMQKQINVICTCEHAWTGMNARCKACHPKAK
jgi:hypothetical protein